MDCKINNLAKCPRCGDWLEPAGGKLMCECGYVEPRNLPEANVKPLLSDVLAEIGKHEFFTGEGDFVVDMNDVREVLSKYFT